jgi:hypothetical protein
MQTHICSAVASAVSDHMLVLQTNLHLQKMIQPQNTLSLQVATTEQQLAQERQTVQQLDGAANLLQQKLDSLQSKLEEQG